MGNTRYIHFRVSNRQFEQIKSNADAEGKKTVSDYLRNLALKFAPEAQVKLIEIHRMTTKILELMHHGEKTSMEKRA